MSGITVLGLEQAIAAPLCTRHLADLGARVIKIEQPGSGDAARHYDGVVRGMAAHFVWLNYGKESEALDLTEPSDLDVARDLLGRPDLAEDPRYAHNGDRVRHRAELDELLGAWCAQRDLAEVQRRADEAGIGNARLNGVRDLAGHPQLAARGRWRQVDSPVGPVPALLPPALARDWTAATGRVLALGADTDAIRAEVRRPGDRSSVLSRTARVHAPAPGHAAARGYAATRSKTAARPCPPPMHIVSRP